MMAEEYDMLNHDGRPAIVRRLSSGTFRKRPSFSLRTSYHRAIKRENKVSAIT